MARRVLVPYAGTAELVEVQLPGWLERRLWWPLAWQMSERERHWLWWLWGNRVHRWPRSLVSRAAGWLVTHTPWWGGPGIARPFLHEHVVEEAPK